MSNIFEDYIGEIEYEEVLPSEITILRLSGLDTKEGLVCDTNTTSLFINRKLVVMNVLGKETVMESVNEFQITDSFGFKIWEGYPQSIRDYVIGFTEKD